MKQDRCPCGELITKNNKDQIKFYCSKECRLWYRSNKGKSKVLRMKDA